MLTRLVDRLTHVPLVGVDLGSAAVKVVELAPSGGQVIIHRCAVAPLEGAAPSEVLKQLCAATGITATHAAVALASPELIVKPFHFPPMPKKELASAIRLEAEEAILNGHASNEMAIDWHLLSRQPRQDVRGLLAVVPKTVVARRVEVVRAAGLRPVVMDVEGLSLWNAYWVLVGSQDAADRTVLLINIGARTTNLVIAKGSDELMLVRDLQLGAAAIGGGHSGDLALEVRDSLSYARSQSGLRTLDAVYVTGGGSSAAAVSLLSSAVHAPVQLWNPLRYVVRNPDAPWVDDAAGPLLATAIGLALRRTT